MYQCDMTELTSARLGLMRLVGNYRPGLSVEQPPHRRHVTAGTSSAIIMTFGGDIGHVTMSDWASRKAVLERGARERALLSRGGPEKILCPLRLPFPKKFRRLLISLLA
jgi:hypothetical protein